MRVQPCRAVLEAIRDPSGWARSGGREDARGEAHGSEQHTRPGHEHEAGEKEHDRDQQRPLLMGEGGGQHRLVQPPGHPHDRVVFLPVYPSANEEDRQDRHERDGQEGRADHRECFGEGEGMKELPFLACQREDRQERQDDDDHREEDRPADLLGGRPDDLEQRALSSIAFDVAKHVFRDHDSGVHEDPDRDRDPSERHDVGSDPEDTHEDEGG